MEAIVLASGLGSRLSRVTGGVPKCFYSIEGRMLVEYPIKSLAEAGASYFILVVPKGYKSLGEKALRECGVAGIVVENKHVELGNAYSTLLAGSLARGDRVMLSCGDTIVPPTITLKLAKSSMDSDVVLAASRCLDYISFQEATKVLVSGDRIVDIGKHIKHAKYIDTGVFIVSRRFLNTWYGVKRGVENHLYNLVKKAVNRGLDARIVDVGVDPWIEIDTPEDLESLLRGSARRVLEFYWRFMK